MTDIGKKRHSGASRRVRMAALLMVGLVAGPGVSAGAEGTAESLVDAWRKAAASAPSLAASASEAAAATAERRALQAARLPTITASGSLARLSQSPALAFDTGAGVFRSPPLFADDEMHMGQVELQMPLFTAGRLGAGIAAARAGETAANAMHASAAADLRLAVARAYVEVLRAERALRVAVATVDSLQAHRHDVAALVERDLAPLSDRLAADVSLAQAEQSRLAATHALALARAAYNREVGEPQDRDIALEPQLPETGVAAERPLAELLQMALQSRPEIDALAARNAQLSAAATAESRRRLPQVVLMGGWQHLGSQLLDRQDYTQLGIGVQWQLFDAGATRERTAALRFAATAAARRTDDARSGIELQVRGAWMAVRDAGARWRVANVATAQAAENERQSRELYGAGLASHTQVLDAVRLHTLAVSGRDQAEFDQALARLALAHAVGSL